MTITVLEASAGTGKTYRVTTLAVEAVADGMPLADMLLVTFTRAATGELRDRVWSRLVSVEAQLGRFLATLDNPARITQGFSAPTSYFATHPAARERMLEAAARADTSEWRSPVEPRREWKPGFAVASDRESFLRRLEGMAVGRPASEGVFVGERFLHPDLGFSLRFPHDWKLVNQSSHVRRSARAP